MVKSTLDLRILGALALLNNELNYGCPREKFYELNFYTNGLTKLIDLGYARQIWLVRPNNTRQTNYVFTKEGLEYAEKILQNIQL